VNDITLLLIPINSSDLIIIIIIIITAAAIELSLGGSCPYASTDNTHKNKYT